MALAHNVIIRGMNAIYLQCEFVTPENAHAFMIFCQCWSEFIHNHHACEEVTYFPIIEKQIGLEGITESNLEQHDAFLHGLERFDDYIARSTPETFSGLVLIRILDTFAATLQNHLTDEVVWILSLKQYPQLDITSIDAQHAQYVRAHQNNTRIIPFLFTNHDMSYEDGIHDWWPGFSKPKDFFLRYLCTFVNRAAWQYSSCSYGGKPKALVDVSWATLSNSLNPEKCVEQGPQPPEQAHTRNDSRASLTGYSEKEDREPAHSDSGKSLGYSDVV